MPNLFRRCPKSGRITGLNRNAIPKWMLPLTALAAIAWFLLRVIPKPSRAAYPCQRVAASLGLGFLSYLAGIPLVCALFRVLRRRGVLIAATAAAALALAIYHAPGLSTPATDPVPQVLTPPEGPNHPIGEAKGIFPGRVVLTQDFAATKWDGKNGHWWDDASVDSAAAGRMLSRSLRSLTGATSDQAAWDKLFRFHNRAAGRGDQGYRPGEKIVIKLNCNADAGKEWTNRGYPAPQMAAALVRQLVETAGVQGRDIILSDPSRYVGAPIYGHVRTLPGAAYREVIFEGQSGDPGPQRVKPEPDRDAPLVFPMPGGATTTLYLPKSFTSATYQINYALLRPHRVFGVTLAAKNHFGSVYDPALNSFKPSALHAFALWEYKTPNHHGDPHCHPLLLGHPSTGGKTILYLADGLYTAYNQTADVVRWSTLNNRWFSGLMLSQDPVAFDSVGYDLVSSEPNLTQGNPSFNGNVDSYLHEAALAAAPPSKTEYHLPSLGVHEHWNNAAARQYSRNLHTGSGIELIAAQ